MVNLKLSLENLVLNYVLRLTIYDDKSNLEYCLSSFDDFLFSSVTNLKLIISGIDSNCRISNRFLGTTKTNNNLVIVIGHVVGNECAENHLFYGLDPSILERGLRILFSRMYQKYAVIDGDAEYAKHALYSVNYLNYLQAESFLLGSLTEEPHIEDLISKINIRMPLGGVIIYFGYSALLSDLVDAMKEAGFNEPTYHLVLVGQSAEKNTFNYELISSFLENTGTTANKLVMSFFDGLVDRMSDKLVTAFNAVLIVINFSLTCGQTLFKGQIHFYTVTY